MMTPERIARLPRGAQEHIALLEMRLREKEARIAELLPDASESDTSLREGMTSDRNLPNGATINFRLGSQRDQSIQVRVDTDRDGAYLDVQGGGTIAISPRASNLVYVRCRER